MKILAVKSLIQLHNQQLMIGLLHKEKQKDLN